MEGLGKRHVTEDMVSRFHELNLQAKEIEAEMAELKELFNGYFDHSVGKHAKGETMFGNVKLQRQIRRSENFIADKTVQKLEELNLNDCIETVKQPDKQKIEAAITLGLLSDSDLKGCKTERITQAIVVKEISRSKK